MQGLQNPGFEKNEAAVVSGRVANYNSCTSVVEIAAAKTPEHEQDEQQQQQQSSTAVFRGFLVVGALSIHELFEGLAVGLEKNAAQVSTNTTAPQFYNDVLIRVTVTATRRDTGGRFSFFSVSQ